VKSFARRVDLGVITHDSAAAATATALPAVRSRGGRVRCQPPVDQVERRQKDNRQQQIRTQQRSRRPEEWHAAQQPREQRGIAQRRQGAADIGHQHDHENHQMPPDPPVRVSCQQRLYHYHRRTGWSHYQAQQHAQQYGQRVARRSPQSPTADEDAARHSV
jgi:hypothetical protein